MIIFFTFNYSINFVYYSIDLFTKNRTHEQL